MWTLRRARAIDLDALLELARAAGVGLTTFPADPDRLEQRLADSDAGDAPLFVLTQRRANGEHVLGVSGLVRSVGAGADAQPFYAYRLERTVHHSDALGVHHEVQALHLLADYDGPTEIGTLFLHPDARGKGQGRLLSLARFLYMANAPHDFKPGVIAELRGVIDEHGQSPFWDAVGSHFFKVDYATADAMSARDKRFIAELMPRHPIYVPLLPEPARNVIGKVHPLTEPAQRLLEHEGFHPTRLVDIFDAGPALRCDLQAIRTVRTSTIVPTAADASINPDDAPTHLACTPDNIDFRAVATPATVTPDHAALPAAALDRLGVPHGSPVRLALIR